MVSQKSKSSFSLGEVVVTEAAFRQLYASKQMPTQILKRHQAGDWGEVDEGDKRRNDQNLEQGNGRLLSAYTLPEVGRVYVTTEPDWKVTTILLPDEW